jgi:hypothetical protein
MSAPCACHLPGPAPVHVGRWWGLVLSGRGKILTTLRTQSTKAEKKNSQKKKTKAENKLGLLQNSLPDAPWRSACFEPRLLPCWQLRRRWPHRCRLSSWSPRQDPGWSRLRLINCTPKIVFCTVRSCSSGCLEDGGEVCVPGNSEEGWMQRLRAESCQVLNFRCWWGQGQRSEESHIRSRRRKRRAAASASLWPYLENLRSRPRLGTGASTASKGSEIQRGMAWGGSRWRPQREAKQDARRP